MAKTTGFKKIAELAPEDRTKVKSYFTELYGAEYAAAMVQDFEQGGKQKEVKASSKKTK